MTPRELHALLGHYILREEREDRRSANITHMLYLINKKKGGPKYDINDFMIHNFKGKPRKKPQPKQQSWQEQLAYIQKIQKNIQYANSLGSIGEI